MVTITGARQAIPLIEQIERIEKSIASLQGVLAKEPVMWRMAADVYIDKTNHSLALQYDLGARDTQAILRAVLSALQNELVSLQAALSEIE